MPAAPYRHTQHLDLLSVRSSASGHDDRDLSTYDNVQTCEPGYQDHDCDEQTECMRCNPGGTARWHSWMRACVSALLMMTLTQQQNVRRAAGFAAEEGHAGQCSGMAPGSTQFHGR